MAKYDHEVNKSVISQPHIPHATDFCCIQSHKHFTNIAI